MPSGDAFNTVSLTNGGTQCLNPTAFKRALEATKGVYQKRTAKGNTWFGIQPCLMV